MKNLLSELEPQERKIYDIGYLDGKEKGEIRGFAAGVALASMLFIIIITILLSII